MRRALTTVLVLLASVLLPFVSSTAADAGGVDRCNASFKILVTQPLTTEEGRRIGQITLSSKAGTSQYCGRVELKDRYAVAANTVQLGLSVSGPTGSGAGLGGPSSAAHVRPIVIDAAGYSHGSRVRFAVTIRGDVHARAVARTSLP